MRLLRRLVFAFLPVRRVGVADVLLTAAITAYLLLVDVIVERYDLQALDWGPEGALVNGVVLGLLLGFRNRVAFDRWWEGRRLWGQLINDTRNLAAKAHALVPAEAEGRVIFFAALPAFAVALKGHLREGVRLRQVPGFEKDPHDPPHVPLYLAGLVLSTLAGWQRRGVLDPAAGLLLDPHARALLDACGGCERIRNTPVCRSYKALLRLATALNILVAPWYTMRELGAWGIPLLLLVVFFLLGIELIDEAVEEPFGTTGDDLDLDSYCATIRASVEQVTAVTAPAA